jgi:tRNA G18 (ribose-2'-O)-methylase SpoU
MYGMMSVERDSRLTLHTVTRVDAPELDPYRCLKDRLLKVRDGLFIVEGLEVIRRMLKSDADVHSLLLTADKLDRLEGDLSPGVPIHVATLPQMESIAGFAIHRGAVACGRRRRQPDFDATVSALTGRQIIVALEGINDAQNVGVIIRNAVAFGASLVLLGGCCDPYYRRAIRVSMGNVFRVPVHESRDLIRDLTVLRDRYGFTLTATVLSETAIPLWEAHGHDRHVLLFGAEGEGLTAAAREVCQEYVTIPMRPGSDSVNVAVASGIFLHHFTANMGASG